MAKTRWTERPTANVLCRGARAPIVLILVLAVALSGCLGSNFVYLSHRAGDKAVMYFKVPTTWKLFGTDQIIESVNGPLSKNQLKQLEAGEWLTYFTDAPHATAKQFAAYGAQYPAGLALERQLSTEEADGYSYSSLRAELLGTDPLTATSGFQVVSYNEFTKPGGLRGSKMVVNITQQSRVIATFEQVGLIDAATQWVFVFGVGCRVSCWGPNQGLLQQLVNTWSVKAPS